MDIPTSRKGEPVSESKRSADEKFCFSCGKTLHVSAKSCPHCGAEQPQEHPPASAGLAVPDATGAVAASALPARHVYCRGCRAAIHETAVSCPHCGAEQGIARVQNPLSQAFDGRNGPSKVTAGLLGILLGGIGAHKFYLGRIGQGFIYLIFFWTGIPAIIGLIEGIAYLTMADNTFQRKYG